jgi:hypothetical protein
LEKFPLESVFPIDTPVKDEPGICPEVVTDAFGVAPVIWTVQVSPTYKDVPPLEVEKVS